MKSTRRQFIGRIAGTVSAVGFLLADPNQAQACMYGTWHLKCPTCGRIDEVTKGTCQHQCSNDGTQVFSGTSVTVVCPKGHVWTIDTGSGIDTYICSTCKSDCNTGPHMDKNSGPKRDPNPKG